MFVEELTKIKESERKADELQKAAKIQSKLVLEEARAKASQILDGAENKAKETQDTLIKEGQMKADEQYESSLDKIRGECSQMMAIAKGNKETAIELIAERIVNSSVNN